MIECKNCHRILYHLRYNTLIEETGNFSLDERPNQVDDCKVFYSFYCPYCDTLISTSLDEVKQFKEKAVIL